MLYIERKINIKMLKLMNIVYVQNLNNNLKF